MATKNTKNTKKKKARRPARKRPAPHPQRQQPESLRLRSMAASFTVNDLDRSVAWYRDVLGFVVGERWEEEGMVRGIQMKAGSCDIMLGQDARPRAVRNPVGRLGVRPDRSGRVQDHGDSGVAMRMRSAECGIEGHACSYS